MGIGSGAPFNNFESCDAPCDGENIGVDDRIGEEPLKGPVGDDFTDDGSDYSTADSGESENLGPVGEDDEEYESDVHEKVRELRAERTFQRRKRRERAPPDSEVGPDIEFDETEIGKISVEGMLGGDEPYYPSSDYDYFKIDEDEYWDEHDDAESGRANVPRRGHNKRGCLKSKGVETSTRAEPASSSRGKGELKKPTVEVETSAKMGREGPKTIAPAVEKTAPAEFHAASSAPPDFHASSSTKIVSTWLLKSGKTTLYILSKSVFTN
ncbi:hypothetical protein K7X08_030421 [Anisodus acutangulus]|uniref:Uncharacterized protein n=1 Tax=Anisodus acutangulus TaxID=402998 RepID=A0A9Q1QXA5_9SOLA|nr:hypothetical protein K7X08_030421 [Anisodus acutangulus]